MSLTLVSVLVSLVIILRVTLFYKKGELSETPSDLQFSNLKNIPGEDYVDLNVVKVGKTRTLFSYHDVGFIKWVDFFYPSSPEHLEKRVIAVKILIGMYAIFGAIGGVMWLVDLVVGIYFVSFMMAAVALVTVLKYVEIVVLGRRPT